MKYKASRMADILFMTSFNRDRGPWPLCSPPPPDPQLHYHITVGQHLILCNKNIFDIFILKIKIYHELLTFFVTHLAYYVDASEDGRYKRRWYTCQSPDAM